MKKVLLGVAVGIDVIVLALVLLGGYIGLIPGVSIYFGVNKPKDLGITYTAQDRVNARTKTGPSVHPAFCRTPPEQSLKYSGQIAVDTAFTQSEFAAWMNKNYAYSPIENVQLRINKDGTVEMSGVINTDNLDEYAKAIGASESDLEVLTDNLKFVKGGPAFYLKGTAGLVNGQINLNVQEAKIGNLSIPPSQLRENKSTMISFAQKEISLFPGFSVKTLTFTTDGKIKFVGTLPAKVSISPSV